MSESNESYSVSKSNGTGSGIVYLTPDVQDAFQSPNKISVSGSLNTYNSKITISVQASVE